MKRWFVLFAIGWLASIAWLNYSVSRGSAIAYWDYQLYAAGFTSVPTLVQVPIVLRLWRCGPSLGRALGILSLPFIGLAIAWWLVAVITMGPREYSFPGYLEYYLLGGWGALPGIVAWLGFLFIPRDFP